MRCTFSALMYNHRTDKNRVDVVDLDPYGTAAPFIDSAVQCINDGGENVPDIDQSLLFLTGSHP
jgi:tRNA G26 N,N-dimethylase Trm1